MIAEKLISVEITPLKPEDSVGFALLQMRHSGLAHLPVVGDGTFFGLISHADISMIGDQEAPLANFSNTLGKIFTRADQHVLEVIRLFARHDVSLLPVLDITGLYMGTISAADVIRSFSSLLNLEQPGSILVLEMKYGDYNMTEIVQIIESNEAKIICYSVTSPPGSEMVEITVKVNRTEIGPLLQAFFRLNYSVIASWSLEDTYHDGLMDRFDALMNYLNI